MLSPKFNEGAQLSANNAVEIPLPDDDPKAMDTLCKVLHFQRESMTEQPSPTDLLTLARLADKYNCTGAIRDTAKQWIEDFRQAPVASDTKSWINMLATAFYFQHARAWDVLCKDVILKSVGSITPIEGDHPEVMHKLFGKTSHERKSAGGI
jgi:hypothetical protein